MLESAFLEHRALSAKVSQRQERGPVYECKEFDQAEGCLRGWHDQD